MAAKKAKFDPKDYAKWAQWVTSDVNRFANRQYRFEREQIFEELGNPGSSGTGSTAFSRGERENTLAPEDMQQKTAPGTEMVVLATPRNLIDKTARILGRSKKTIEYTPDAPDLQEPGQIIENALRWIDKEWTQRHSMGLRTPMQYELGRHAALRGWLCSRVTLNPNRKDKLPVLRTVHDAANVYPYEVGGKLVRVTEQYTASVSDLVSDPSMIDGEEWLSSLDDGSASMQVSSVYVEVEGKFYHAIIGMMSGDPKNEKGNFLKKPKEIGYMPWVITLVQGASYRGTSWDSAGAYLEWMGTGVLTPLADNFRYRNKQASMLMTVLANSTNPPIVIYTDDEAATAEQIKNGLKPGQIVLLGSKQSNSFELVRVGPNPGDFQEMRSLLEEVEYKGSLHSSMWGDPTGVTSGFQAAIVKGNALDFLFPLDQAMRLHEALVLRKALEIIANHWPEQMNVFLPAAANRPAKMAQLDPTIIDACGYTGISVDFEDVTPQDFTAAANTWALLVREQLASMKRARGRHGLKFDDPELEDQEVMADLVKKDPQLIKFLVPFALAFTGQKLSNELYGALHGTDLENLLLAASQNAQLLGQPPGGTPQGAPGQPPAAPPMMDGAVLPPVMQTGVQPDLTPEQIIMAQTVLGGIGGGGIPPAGGEGPLLPGPLMPGV